MAAAALLVAGCSGVLGGGQSATPAGPLEKTDITVAAVPSFDAAGLYIAQQRGYFAQAGLHVTIKPIISARDVLRSQLAGHIDVSFGNYVSYIPAMADQGARLHLLSPGTIMSPGTQMLLVPANSRIQDVGQLAGKRVGVNALNNIGSLLVDSLLDSRALQPGAVTYVAIPFPLMTKALQDHKVDAAWLPEPFVTSAEESIGAQPIADADAGLAQSVPIVGYVCTQTWLRSHPRTAAAFARAIARAQLLASQSAPIVQQTSAKYVGVTPQTAAIVPVPQFQLRTDPLAVQRVADLMLQFGILQHGFSTTQFVH